MKVVILGAGRRGFALAKYLVDDGANVIVIDNDEMRVNNAKDKLDLMAITGSGLDLGTLRGAGIEGADMFAAVTDKDEINLISCGIVGSEFGIHNTVASVSNLNFTGSEGLRRSIFGVGCIVNPEEETAINIRNMMDSGIYGDVITFSGSSFVSYSLEITALSPIADTTVNDIRQTVSVNFIITAIMRGDHVFVPSGRSEIVVGDVISVVSDRNDIPSLLRDMLGREKAVPKKSVIVGGTQIASYLLNSIPIYRRSEIVLIDKDPSVCSDFYSRFPEILALNGDLATENILEENNLVDADFLISLEDSDELNTIIAAYAKKCGIKHSVALAKHKNNYSVLRKMMGIDFIISTTDSAVMSLLSYINAGGLSSVHSIFDGKIEIYEMTVAPLSMAVGRRLMDMDMKGRGVIAAVRSKNKTCSIPGGKYEIKSDDILLMVAAKGHMTEIKKMFS